MRNSNMAGHTIAEKKAARFLNNLKPGENVLIIGEFSGIKAFAINLALVVALILVNRFVIGKSSFTMMLNILVVLFSFEASKALAQSQSSVVIATNHRIIGTVNLKPIDLEYRDIQSIGIPERIFLDTGSPKTSVRLQGLTNSQEFFRIIRQLYENSR